MKDLGYKIVWPCGKRSSLGVRFAKRLGTLKGKTVCELWNRAFRGDEMFPVIARG